MRISSSIHSSRHEVVEVALAGARRHAGDEPVADAGLEARHRVVEHVLPAAALVADGLRALDADERRGVAGPAELAATSSVIICRW
jgi:hypothetical protein